HEVSKIEVIDESVMREMLPDELLEEFRSRALTPDHPVTRGTAQNSDVFFQEREAANVFYDLCPHVVQRVMNEFAKRTGRQYHLFDYVGSPTAERVVVLMGSGCEAAQEAADYLNSFGENVGVLKVRLYRPFDSKRFVEALPRTVKSIAVLDRTKEPGASGEPLFQDCIAALHEGLTHGWGQIKAMPRIIGGRYGLSSKEFTPAMV